MSTSVPLVHVRRGGRLESIHCGSFVLLDGEQIIEAAGDPHHVAYYRSTAKPFQAMVAVTSGAAEQFGFTSEELAIAAGSHNASPHHLGVVRSILAKAGVDESALGCGGHWSIDPELARRQAREYGTRKDPLPRIWSNCSGKHAAMLAAARALGAPLDTYLDAQHPVQHEITAIVAAFAGMAVQDIGVGMDGCGAPIHALPVRAMARSLMQLGRPEDLPERYRVAGERVGAAMSEHPEMIAGKGRFDTDLMENSAQRILSKGGAEGIHGIAVPERHLGLAVHVDDGNDRGYRQLVIALLLRHGVLTEEEADGLAERHGRTIRNWTGAKVGELQVVV
ncbi:MAG: asparaginase [Planctomycetota bacterium]|nr:asparaginase [Planctomycetota bacterium]